MPFITGLIMGAAITVFLALAACAAAPIIIDYGARRLEEEGDQ